jgi:hypothetical protein
MGRSQRLTSNCSQIGCAKGPIHTLNHSPSDTQTLTQQWARNIHHSGNNKHVQQFDEIVLTWQQ